MSFLHKLFGWFHGSNKPAVEDIKPSDFFEDVVNPPQHIEKKPRKARRKRVAVQGRYDLKPCTCGPLYCKLARVKKKPGQPRSHKLEPGEYCTMDKRHWREI